MDQMTAAFRAKAGRPTREQAEARQHALLETALDHFLDKGFEQATIEAIAQDVGMTKRTVYARYPDKVSLFRAAVNLAIERYTVAPAVIEATDKGDLEATLIAVAWLRVEQVMTTNGLRLQRIINSESYRFPDIFEPFYRLASQPTVRFLAAILERETGAGRLALSEPEKAANAFMSMVVGGPVRAIVLGGPMPTLSRDDLADRIEYAVRLFLNGARPR
jgi:TetR/AcrR family transcriptional regulator, mexJK operon transcriptional repressor